VNCEQHEGACLNGVNSFCIEAGTKFYDVR
jgi:hypothetical protein